MVDEDTDGHGTDQGEPGGAADRNEPGPGQDDRAGGGPYHLVPVRRRPDMVRFLVAGAFLGFVAGAVVGRYGPDAPYSSALQEIILLGATGLLVGLLVGSVAYLVADRISQR